MNVANKVKVFIWQLAHNALPTNCNITISPICHRFDEDVGHYLLKCKSMRQCLLLLDLEDVRISLVYVNSAMEFLEKI